MIDIPNYDAWKTRSPEDERERLRPRVPDDFSIEFEFEELEIKVDEVFFGWFWGTAELVLNDPANGDFYVKSIAIDGSKIVTRKGFREREEAVLHLPWPAPDNRSCKAHLFRKIEEALYADEHALEVWARSLEGQDGRA